MAALSVKERMIQAGFNPALGGLRQLTLHPFYWGKEGDTALGWPADAFVGLPAETMLLRNKLNIGLGGVAGSLSVREWSARLMSSGSLAAIGDYPGNLDTGYTNNLNGVAHDEAHWYFSQANPPRLWKIYALEDLDQDVDNIRHLTRSFESVGYSHFGDIDFFDGRLYVAAENGPAPAVLVFDRELSLLGVSFLAGKTDCPWCAINPLNGYLYSSEFNNARSYVRLLVYDRPSERSNWVSNYLGSMLLFDESGSPIELNGLQGGAFSPAGDLFLVSDAFIEDQSASDGGVFGFNMITGRRFTRMVVDYDPWLHVKIPIIDVTITTQRAQELEGVTYWENSPRIGGSVHLIMGDKNVAGDHLYFKHYSL
jgi:hypothetical protein